MCVRVNLLQTRLVYNIADYLAMLATNYKEPVISFRHNKGISMK